MRTWKLEAALVAVILFGVVLATGGRPVEWLGALAVLVSFMHCQVGFRLSEAEEARVTARSELDAAARGDRVDCYRWLMRYHVGKEVLWCAYFSWLGAWSALVGVGVFLLYPVWRTWRGRRRGPCDRAPVMDGTV